MEKVSWIGFYRSISNPGALAEYARLGAPAIIAASGRFLARGGTARTYDAGIDQRTVLIEFDSVAQAVAAHDSPGYQAALTALGGAAERDIRIVETIARKTTRPPVTIKPRDVRLRCGLAQTEGRGRPAADWTYLSRVPPG
jgi:uncharacterized protein (DUF1330 family)